MNRFVLTVGACAFAFAMALPPSFAADMPGRSGAVAQGDTLRDVQMMTGCLTATTDRTGWTVGTGLEYAFLGPWSAKVEYLYTDLGSASCGAATCGAATTVSYNVNIIRFGVNYRFW